MDTILAILWVLWIIFAIATLWQCRQVCKACDRVADSLKPLAYMKKVDRWVDEFN